MAARLSREELEDLAEMRRLLGLVVDIATLGNLHAISVEEWERACLLSGRYCEPYLSAIHEEPLHNAAHDIRALGDDK
jgi:hypothetical protein